MTGEPWIWWTLASLAGLIAVLLAVTLIAWLTQHVKTGRRPPA